MLSTSAATRVQIPRFTGKTKERVGKTLAGLGLAAALGGLGTAAVQFTQAEEAQGDRIACYAAADSFEEKQECLPLLYDELSERRNTLLATLVSAAGGFVAVVGRSLGRKKEE